MRYREGYFREDIESYAENIESMRGEQLKDAKDGLAKGQLLNERVFHRRFDEKMKTMIINFKNKQEEFNRIAYKKVEEVVEHTGAGFKYQFDNYATGFGILAEEFLSAKNTTELLTVCKLYNQGLMENTFAEIRKQRENEKTNIVVDSNNSIANDSDNIVQEGESSASATSEPTEQSEQH